MGLFSSIGKALFGGKSKKKETTTTATKDPYAPVIPYVNSYLKDTADLYAGPDFSEFEQNAIDNFQSTYDSNQGYLKQALDQNADVIAGKYLTPDTNPYLADIAKRVSGLAGATTQSMFGSSGRTGSGLAGYYGGKAVGDSLTDLYGAQYDKERAYQENAKSTAAGLTTASLGQAGALTDLGQTVSNRPFERNANYGGILTQIGNLGGDTSGTTTEYKQSRGLFGDIFNSLTNSLFGTTRPTG